MTGTRIQYRTCSADAAGKTAMEYAADLYRKFRTAAPRHNRTVAGPSAYAAARKQINFDARSHAA